MALLWAYKKMVKTTDTKNNYKDGLVVITL